MSEENQNTAPNKQEAGRGDPGGCFMCQIHDALMQDYPEGDPPPIRTVQEAENYLKTMMYCGLPIVLAIRYRRTRFIRRFFIWVLVTLLLTLAVIITNLVLFLQ